MPRTVRVYDEYAFGFSWVLEEGMQRSSHALVLDGRVWLIDPARSQASCSCSTATTATARRSPSATASST